MELKTFSRTAGLALALAGLGAGSVQAQDFQPGQNVEYKSASWPETWAKGVFVRELPGGTQVLIRQAPTQFFPEGFERAYALADVRPVTQAAAPPQPAMAPAPAPAPVARARPAPVPERAPPMGGGMGGGGGAPMTEQDVLAFLRERLGTGDPFQNPKREAVLQALREEVLRRGVAFRKQAIGPFANELGKYGALSNVTYAMSNNYGPPATRNQLMGNWRLVKVGATTTVTRGGNLYQRQEYAGLAGTLNLTAGGDYVWNSPSGLLRGKWRNATPAEMAQSDKGGEGVVLLGAKSGADWLVFRRTEEGPEGTGIMITDLATRNLRERGTR